SSCRTDFCSGLHSCPTRRSSDLTPISKGGWCRVRIVRQFPAVSSARTPSPLPLERLPASCNFNCLFALPPSLRQNCKPLVELKIDRKSTRLNSSHLVISYAVFCL